MKRFISLLLLSTFILTSFAQNSDQKNDQNKIKPALLVVDVQNAYVKSMDEKDLKVAVQTINGVIKYFKYYKFPIVQVYHTDKNWGPPKESKEFQFIDEIELENPDKKIIKNYPSSFKKTELQKYLNENDVNTLFICGLSATGCVLATYRGADDLDFDVFMIKNGLISPDRKHTKVIEEISNTVGWKALALLLESAKN